MRMSRRRLLSCLMCGSLLAIAGISPSAPAQTTAPNEWTWMGGSSTPLPSGAPGVYGTFGVPAPGNIPGQRTDAATWSDSSGNLWLFGGSGFDANGVFGYLNDLWEYNPTANEWAWMGGSNTLTCIVECNAAGVYGTIRVPASGNVPGSRIGSATWTDDADNLWMFGGIVLDASSGNEEMLNDLWEFNPSANLWTWIGGNSTPGSNSGHPGVYGTLGTPSSANIPGSRSGASAWTDSSGNFWLFGGSGLDSAGRPGDFQNLNDLWAFSPTKNLWTWMGGASTTPFAGGRIGVYGILGVPGAGNIPGGRADAVSWADSNSNLWLFGGGGYDSIGNYGSEGCLNDLWEFTPSSNEWTWMGGSNTIGSKGGRPGIYGSLGTPAADNIPGCRDSGVVWPAKSAYQWLFGGEGYDANGTFGYLNDLWLFNPATNQWTWMGGSTSNFQQGVYGSRGKPDAGNTPGGRTRAASWTDIRGNLWLFGGLGVTAAGSGAMNDLWVYQPSSATLPATSTPTLSVVSGIYTSAQTVSISDTTPGATIYYTTNGTAPTTNSTQYTGAITVAATETIQAIAVASGYSTSAVASAAYTINLPPDFSVAATPGSQSVTGGQSATTSISVTPANGFNSAVSFSCSGLPSDATCSFSPATVTPTGAAASTALTVTTTTADAALHGNSRPLIPVAALAALLCCFGLRKRRRLLPLLVALSSVGLSLLSACGGGGSYSGGGGGGGGSRSATYTVTVNATSGTLHHATSFSLTVN